MKTEINVQRVVDSIMPFVSIGGINNRDLFNRAILNQHHRGQPIQIAGFIGQGEKDHLGRSDIELSQKYDRLKNELGRIYPFAVEVSLIGADLHGKANGKPDTGYLSLMKNEAVKFKFNWRQLSELYQDKGLQLPDLKHVESILFERESYEFQKWNSLPAEVRNALIGMAKKHWGDKALLGAFYYFLMRQNEFLIFYPFRLVEKEMLHLV